jgi:hypothetical protein
VECGDLSPLCKTGFMHREIRDNKAVTGARIPKSLAQLKSTRIELLLAPYTKPLLVFGGAKECLHHFSGDEVAIELIQLIEPEIITLEIIVWRIVGIPKQIAEVLHQDKRLIEFFP